MAAILVFSLFRSNRGELEIICDVLEVCLNGANKHKIIYKTELNTSTFNKYLNRLLRSGFLTVRVAYDAGEYPDVRVFYETTESGLDFLEACVNMLNRLGKVRKRQIAVKPMEKTSIRV